MICPPSIALVILLSAALFSFAEATSKRDLLDLTDIIRAYTGRRARDYNNYGCWCGLGGGGTPKDEIDRCCKTHDECYKSTGCFLWEQIVPIKKRCGGGSCQCLDTRGTCAHNACTCDVQFGQCIGIQRNSYNSQNKGNC